MSTAFILGSGLQNYIDAVSDDLNPASTISNEQIAAIIVKSIRRINLKLETSFQYIVGSSGIVPTPSETLGAFIVMQAECLLAKMIRSTAISKGIRVRDGDSEIDTTAGFSGQNDLVNDICGELDKMISQYRAGLIGDNDIASRYGQIIWYGNSKIIEELDHDGEGSGRTRDQSSQFEDDFGRSTGLGRSP